jgi:ribosome-associated protein
MSNRDDDDRGPDASRRQIARRERRDAGDQSARLANRLMKLPDSTLGKLDLEEELRDAIMRARAVTSPSARRRAERTLAGDLRGVDLDALETSLANVQSTGAAESRLLQLAEHWRARFLEEGTTAAAAFPGGAAEPLPALIQQARRERDTGKPPGAARKLFRHVMAVLKAQATAASKPASAPADDDRDPEDD